MRLVLLYLLAATLGAILGIDYGQQFTKASLLAPGVNFEILLTEEARRKDLSGISIRSPKKDDLERVYGSAATSLCTRFPANCIAGIKPLLGKSLHDEEVSQYLTTHFGVKIIEDTDRSNGIKFDLGFANQSYAFTVEEVLAMTLKELRSRAFGHLKESPTAKAIVDDVAISVPPFFSQEQRQAYLDALELAGFTNILGLVDEGTAVAVNLLTKTRFEQKDYNNEKRYNLIYDIGAGSTKATLFSVTPFSNLTTVLELESIGYDEKFGGLLLTESIYSILIEKLASSLSLDETSSLPPKAAARLYEAAEKAKIILSANADYHVSIESILDDKDFRSVITREEFEEINIDHMARITKPIQDALSDTGITINDVEAVILTGGSSRVPFVQKHLSIFVGEDKIAKTVNADESCTVGTTARAFRLKTKFGTSKDFEIIDKSYHNYEVNFNGEESLVFEKGSVIDTTKRISFGELPEEISIQLYEDGRLLKSFNINKVNNISCNDDKKYSKQVFGTFALDGNKIFGLKKLEAECVKESGFFDKLLKKEDEQESEEPEAEAEVDQAKNGTNSSSSDTRPSRKVLRPVPIGLPRPVYPNIKPLSKPSKERIVEKLLYLDSRDEFKIHLDNTKNRLEAACYALRNSIDDNEDKIEDELSVDDLRTKVSETIEWLEFESDDAPIEEFEKKIRQIELRRDEINNILKMGSTDLSLAGLTKLYEDGTSIIMKIQTKMLEFGSQISEVRNKYGEKGFDFDKENDRIKIQLLSKGEDKMLTLDKGLARYKELLTDLGDITQLNEHYFNEIPKVELYEKFEAISESIVQMLADLLMLDESHQERVKLFNEKYELLVERQAKKELRDRLKAEEKAKKKAEKAKEADESEASEPAEPIEEPEAVEPSEPVDSDTEIEHDEL